MSRNKKPAVIVAVALCALMTLPILIMMISRTRGGGSGGASPSEAPEVIGSASVANYDLRQLAERAESLLNNELAAAVRKGDVSLDFVMRLKKDFDKAESALASGKDEKAQKLYAGVVQAAETELSALVLADQARALKDSTYVTLQRLEYLNAVFEKTYAEAVSTYNEALAALNASQYEESLKGFEMSAAILGDLEARSVQQIGSMLEAAQAALDAYELDAARAKFQSVLEIDPNNAVARAGLETVEALAEIADEVKSIEKLEAAGYFEKALAELEAVVAQYPHNSFLKSKREDLQQQIIDRDYAEFIAKAGIAEGEGNYAAAIEALEAALKLKFDPEQQARLEDLKAKYKAARLESLLQRGYDSLKAGRYTEARDIYKEAVDLAPESQEARNGYQKASSLHLASIRYTQGIEDAAKYIQEGRYPVAAKFFNTAMGAKPSNITMTQQKEETRIRNILQQQSQEASISIKSDKKTYVSIIGVFPPEKLKSKELKLYPDVYKIRGTRRGYQAVEIELRVDATKSNQSIEVICTEKQ